MKGIIKIPTTIVTLALFAAPIIKHVGWRTYEFSRIVTRWVDSSKYRIANRNS